MDRNIINPSNTHIPPEQVKALGKLRSKVRVLDLPAWVWDILADMVEHEDYHAQGDSCFKSTLERVPEDILKSAGIIAAYRRSKEQKND